MSKGWGIKVNYPAEIAADEARIALYSSPMAIAISAAVEADPAAMAANHDGYLTGHWFLFGNVATIKARLALAGLSIEDAAHYVRFSEGMTGDAEIDAAARALLSLPHDACLAARERERVVAATIADLPVCFEAERVAIVRKAKASLARHKRNAVKYGTT